jgi:transposase
VNQYLFDDEVERHFSTVHFLIGALVGERIGVYVLRQADRDLRFFRLALDNRQQQAGREDRLAQCERLEAALREAVVNWRFYPAVLGLQAMRGVQFTTAVGMLAELGDLSRFAHPRQLMAWIGVTPSEHSSGDKRRQGSITKTGNSYARKLLVEAAWSYRHPARVSPEIQRRHEGLPKAIVDRAWDAQVRLCRRYRNLIARGKNQNVGVVAVAREFAGFIWDISRLSMSLAVRHEVHPT